MTITSTTTSKVAKITTGADGYGGTIHRATIVQPYNDGVQMQERFVSVKTGTEKAVIKWANKQLA